MLAAAFFVYIQILHGTSADIGKASMLIRPLAFFLAFAVVSLCLWGYFRWDGRPTAKTEPDDAPLLEAVIVAPEVLPASAPSAEALSDTEP